MYTSSAELQDGDFIHLNMLLRFLILPWLQLATNLDAHNISFCFRIMKGRLRNGLLLLTFFSNVEISFSAGEPSSSCSNLCKSLATRTTIFRTIAEMSLPKTVDESIEKREVNC